MLRSPSEKDICDGIQISVDVGNGESVMIVV